MEEFNWDAKVAGLKVSDLLRLAGQPPAETADIGEGVTAETQVTDLTLSQFLSLITPPEPDLSETVFEFPAPETEFEPYPDIAPAPMEPWEAVSPEAAIAPE